MTTLDDAARTLTDAFPSKTDEPRAAVELPAHIAAVAVDALRNDRAVMVGVQTLINERGLRGAWGFGITLVPLGSEPVTVQHGEGW